MAQAPDSGAFFYRLHFSPCSLGFFCTAMEQLSKVEY